MQVTKQFLSMSTLHDATLEQKQTHVSQRAGRAVLQRVDPPCSESSRQYYMFPIDTPYLRARLRLMRCAQDVQCAGRLRRKRRLAACGARAITSRVW